MKHITFIVCLLLAFGSSASSKKINGNVHFGFTIQEVRSDTMSSNQRWMHAINKKDLNALKTLYTQNVYGLSASGIELSGRDELLRIVAKNNFVVNDVRTIKRVKANSRYDYEIGSFKNSDGILMMHVVIWDTSQGGDKRELEFLAETDDSKTDMSAIDQSRSEWMRLCNAHNAANLINTVYTKNTMYYNHRPMIVGRESLIPVYAYMNSPSYRLTLSPIHVESVSETLVFEIGQCKGSYPGKYIIIWQKTEEGWQVLFDSNI